MSVRGRTMAWVLVGLTATAGSGAAQTVGSFRWQQQPYCNVIQIDIVQQGALYRLDGFDDQCGAATRAAATGLAYPNPDGSIGFGLTIVTAPGAMPVHLVANIALPALSGTWTGGGSNGAWTFVPGAGLGGAPRPAPSGFPSGGFSAGGGAISNLAPPTAGGDAANKSYVDAENAADRGYAVSQDGQLRAYVDGQDQAARVYVDAQNQSDRAFSRALASTPATASMIGAHLVTGFTSAVGCTEADIDLGISVYQALAVPEGATLSAVRLTYRRGVTNPGFSLTMQVRATDFSSGSPATSTLATRAVTTLSNTYVTETLPLPTPYALSAGRRAYMFVASSSSSGSFCGATPIFTMP